MKYSINEQHLNPVWAARLFDQKEIIEQYSITKPTDTKARHQYMTYCYCLEYPNAANFVEAVLSLDGTRLKMVNISILVLLSNQAIAFISSFLT